MKRIFAGVVLSLLAATSVSAQESQWVDFQESDGMRFSARKGSFSIQETQGGETAATMIVQTYEAAKDRVGYRIWYIATRDCEAGYGKVAVLDMAGEFKFEVDFVAGGESLASGGADLMCELYRRTR